MMAGQSYYLVPSKWWALWEQYALSTTTGGDSEQKSNEVPNTIDTTPLEDPKNKGMLDPSVAGEPHRYKAVPEAVWKGLTRFRKTVGPVFKRTVVEKQQGKFVLRSPDYQFWHAFGGPGFQKLRDHRYADGDEIKVVKQRGGWIQVENNSPNRDQDETWVILRDRVKPHSNGWDRMDTTSLELDLFPRLAHVHFCYTHGSKRGLPDPTSKITLEINSTQIMKQIATRLPRYLAQHIKDSTLSSSPLDGLCSELLFDYCIGSEKDNTLSEREVSQFCRVYWQNKVDRTKRWIEITDEQLDLYTVGDLAEDGDIQFLVDVEQNWLEKQELQEAGEKRWSFQSEQSFEVYDIVDVKDHTGKWYEAQIIEKKESMGVKIHYINCSAKWDEWIALSSEKLAARSTYTKGPHVVKGRYYKTSIQG